jgi:hypothetical protein
MQRVLDIFQLCFYLIGRLVMLWVGADLTTRLTRLDREWDRNAILYEQMLQEHREQGKTMSG